MDKQYMEYIGLCWLASWTIEETKTGFLFEFGYMSSSIERRIERYHTLCDSHMKLEELWRKGVN
jgi:hypothetical protein